mmetsp:Transcript_31086/g.76105  ORF Transcript_31086/g.76105 Transcript_31086/m.76105 type:complete len:215 (+) Transcript_31086:1144-1788(+)
MSTTTILWMTESRLFTTPQKCLSRRPSKLLLGCKSLLHLSTHSLTVPMTLPTLLLPSLPSSRCTRAVATSRKRRVSAKRMQMVRTRAVRLAESPSRRAMMSSSAEFVLSRTGIASRLFSFSPARPTEGSPSCSRHQRTLNLGLICSRMFLTRRRMWLHGHRAKLVSANATPDRTLLLEASSKKCRCGFWHLEVLASLLASPCGGIVSFLLLAPS